MNLFEINEKIANCFRISETEVIDADTGEVLDADYLADLELQKDEKIENIAKFIKNLDSDAKQLKEQKELFAKRQKAAENKRDALKKYLSDFLNGEKWNAEDLSVAVSFRKSESVNIINEADIPEEYLIIQPSKIDKAAIKKAIKSGASVNGAEIEINNNIQIK